MWHNKGEEVQESGIKKVMKVGGVEVEGRFIFFRLGFMAFSYGINFVCFFRVPARLALNSHESRWCQRRHTSV